MAIDFPVAAANGEVFKAANTTFIWNGQGWTTDGTGFVPPAPVDDWVNVTGDTMTGNLILKYPSTQIVLDKTGASASNSIVGNSAGVNHWIVELGNSSPDSSFAISRFDDAGTNLGGSFGINRATGTTELSCSAGYNMYLQNSSIPKRWGLANDAQGGLLFDDVSQAHQVAQFTAWNGTWATLALPFAPTSAAAPNCYIGGTWVHVSTSSLRYKDNIEALTKAEADKLLLLEPITFTSKCAVDDPIVRHLGFIAEDVATIEPKLVQYEYLKEDYIEENIEGQASKRTLREGAVKVPDGLAYDRISVLAVFKLKEQEARIADLEARLAALEGAV